MHSLNRTGLANNILRAVVCAALFLAPVIPSARAQSDSQKKSPDFNAGVSVSGQATPKEVGLPAYPGAKPHKDADEDSSSANLGLWGGDFGFKLVVLKLDSGDSLEKISAFYKKALAKYGPVLDCSSPPANSKDDKSQENSAKLTCGDDKADNGGKLFKSGTKEKQHIVSIKPASAGNNIDLVYLEARGSHKAM